MFSKKNIREKPFIYAFKRIIIVGIAAIVFFSCNACGKERLIDYKSTSKVEIQNYANAKIEDCYNAENWEAICGYVEGGKKAVEVAKNRAMVSTAVDETKMSIDAVEPIGLYSLEFAHEQGFLFSDDVRSIGYYHNGEKEWTECVCGHCDDRADTGKNKCAEGFQATTYKPQAKISIQIDNSLQAKIKQSWIKYVCHIEGLSKEVASSMTISVGEYYGTYNGYVAMMIHYGDTQPVIGTPIIADTVFYYSNSNRILLWKESK